MSKVINNQKDLWKEINEDKPKWKFEYHQSMFTYNITSIYREGDLIWKLQDNYIKPLGNSINYYKQLYGYKLAFVYLSFCM